MSMNVKMKPFVKTMELALTLKDHMYAVVWKDGKAITVKQVPNLNKFKKNLLNLCLLIVLFKKFSNEKFKFAILYSFTSSTFLN